MATFAGKDGIVELGTDAVSQVRRFDLTTEASVADDTVMGATWESHLVTFRRWSGTIECLWDDSDTTGQDVLLEGASVTVHLLPEGTVTGDVDYTGTATVTQVVRRVAHDGLVEATFNFQGSGALTVTTQA